MEIWKDIEDYEGFYQVSNLGRVKRLQHTTKAWNRHKVCNRNLPEKVLKLGNDKDGYKVVGLKGKSFRVHRLVAITFLGKSELPQVNHKNLNKADNRVDNLEWCSHSYNQIHSYDVLGTSVIKGENNPNSKLNEKQVLKIKEMLECGISQVDIAKFIGVSSACIGAVKLGYTWTHVTGFKITGKSKNNIKRRRKHGYK